MELRLLPEGPDRLDFLAGQYIEIVLSEGKRRAFSLANAPKSGPELHLHVRRYNGGAFSDLVFSGLEEQAMLRIEGPFGQFFLREEGDRPILFVAGGTGFAPVKAIVEFAIQKRVPRPMHVYWGVQARGDLYADELPRRWADQYAHIHYVPVLSDHEPDDEWEGRTGLVHEAVLTDFENLSPFDVYASGPPAMVTAIWETFLSHGVHPDHVFFDAFEPAQNGTLTPP